MSHRDIDKKEKKCQSITITEVVVAKRKAVNIQKEHRKVVEKVLVVVEITVEDDKSFFKYSKALEKSLFLI